MSLLATLNHMADRVNALVDEHPSDYPNMSAPTAPVMNSISPDCDDRHSSCSTAPALANLALLLAQGDANKYVQVIKGLYQDNGLILPNFSGYLEQPEKEPSVEPFEDDISFMADFEEYCQTDYPQTAFTKEYHAICPIETRDIEDWFDQDSSGKSLLNEINNMESDLHKYSSGGIFVKYTEPVDESFVVTASNPMPDLERRLSLLRHSDLLFDLILDSVPEGVRHNIMQQLEHIHQVDSIEGDNTTNLSILHIMDTTMGDLNKISAISYQRLQLIHRQLQTVVELLHSALLST